MRQIVNIMPTWCMAELQLRATGEYVPYEYLEGPEYVYRDVSQDIEIDMTFDEYNALKPSYFGMPLTWVEKNRWASSVQDYDRDYQYNYIDNGLAIKGKTPNVKIWNQMANIVDWKDKTVLDVGCFLGYYCYQAELRGAKAVVGIDTHEGTAGYQDSLKLKDVRRSKALLLNRDICDCDLGMKFDIILCLNMFHHILVRDQRIVLEHMDDMLAGKIVFVVLHGNAPLIKQFFSGYKITYDKPTERGRQMIIMERA